MFHRIVYTLMALSFVVCAGSSDAAASDALHEGVYQVGTLKPVDSTLRVKVGDRAPEFTLRAVSGGAISLKDYLGKKNIMISFVPAAWTPVCSDQWPGYNLARDEFEQFDTMVIGISVDNIPTLYAWTKTMGTLWFPVLSDFWPHGRTAEAYGVLRSDGITERAIFIIDKQGIIRYIDVHDINSRPPLEGIITELEKMKR
jgi:peroxiredoxin (alkyl hydroperoxide reductase subunit C)